MYNKFLLTALTLSCAFNNPSFSGQSNGSVDQYSPNSSLNPQILEQQAATNLLRQIINIEVQHQQYITAIEVGESTRDFTDSIDSLFKGLDGQLETIQSVSGEIPLEDFDLFFQKFDSLKSSMGSKEEFRNYFSTTSNKVTILKSKLTKFILKNRFNKCKIKSFLPNSEENESLMIALLNSLSEYKCYTDTYSPGDMNKKEEYVDGIKEYFGIIKNVQHKNITHTKVKKSRNLIASRRGKIVSHTSRKRIFSQDYREENDLFTQHVLGHPEEMQHLNTKNGKGRNAIELAIDLRLEDVAQELTEALSNFAQVMEDSKKIEQLPKSYRDILTNEEISMVIKENQNVSDEILYQKLHEAIQNKTKANMQSGRLSDTIQADLAKQSTNTTLTPNASNQSSPEYRANTLEQKTAKFAKEFPKLNISEIESIIQNNPNSGDADLRQLLNTFSQTKTSESNNPSARPKDAKKSFFSTFQMPIRTH